MKQIIITILLSVITFLVPIKGLIILISLTIGLDTIVGIYTSKKLNIPIQSHKFFNLVIKSFFYMSTIVLAYIIDVHILGGTLPILSIPNGLSKIITIIWVINEIKSIDESSQKLGYPPFLTMLKNLMTKAKEIKKDLNELVDDDKKDKTE